MNLGKQVRLNRLFSHPSGRLCAVAVDHFASYSFNKFPEGLARMRRTLERLVAGRPDSITMQRGVATLIWPRFAGTIPFILQSTICRHDDTCYEQLADAEDAVRLGADAIAVVGYVRGATESRYLKTVAECVKSAARYEIPVVAHMYPRTFDDGVRISFVPEDIAWATHCAVECGADVVKVPYCNDVKAYAGIVAESPVPVVAAGGPQTKTLEDALAMLHEIVQSGARGAVVGRNVWGFPKITEAVVAMRAVVHDGKSARQAMKLAGLG